jgi:CO/xanthine dehydrogenase Mo-binding subunit
MRVGLKANGRISLHMGAVDIGQGSATAITQICAEALGVPIDKFDLVGGDTDITPDSAKTSATMQAFVSGHAMNPTLIEGQIEGGTAQGLGMVLMEEFFHGRGENLHDYLIPTIGDMPEVQQASASNDYLQVS